MTRSHAWVRKGDEYIERTPTNWGRNLTLLGAIRLNGWVVLSTMFASTNKARFVHWLARKLLPRLKSGDVLVLDNLAAHHDRRVVPLCAARGVRVALLARLQSHRARLGPAEAARPPFRPARFSLASTGGAPSSLPRYPSPLSPMVRPRRIQGLSSRVQLRRSVGLGAAVNGPFFFDWEFSTLFGLTRSEVAAVLRAWPDGDDPVVQDRAVANAINHLLGYPHDDTESWDRYVRTPRDEIARLRTSGYASTRRRKTGSPHAKATAAGSTRPSSKPTSLAASVLGGRRIATLPLLRREVARWAARAGANRRTINWTFRVADARRVFRYHGIETLRSEH